MKNIPINKLMMNESHEEKVVTNKKPVISFYTGTIGEHDSLDEYANVFCMKEEYHVIYAHLFNDFFDKKQSKFFKEPIHNWKFASIHEFFNNLENYVNHTVIVYEALELDSKILIKMSNYMKKKLKNNNPFGGIKMVFLYDFYCLVHSDRDFVKHFYDSFPDFEMHFYSQQNGISVVCDYRDGGKNLNFDDEV